MRLWHKDLISVLPKAQLISQWRECCAIAKSLSQKGTPNHILVNKVLEYTPDEFMFYTQLVVKELQKRKYKVTDKAWLNYYNNMVSYAKRSTFRTYKQGDIFKRWHDKIYLGICYSNLYEKYICGGITRDEFRPIMYYYSEKILKE